MVQTHNEIRSRTCSTCGSAILPDVPFAQCPRCLLDLGVSCTLPSPDFRTAENRTVFDETAFDYELLEKIGYGAMGVVYRARQRSLDRLVAIKMIRVGDLASPAVLARFRREAETVARLDHPNIVPIIEIGERQGHPFLVMRLVAGQNLAVGLSEFVLPRVCTHPEARQKQHRISSLLGTIARAVDFAHQRGVIHRDLKPSNILLDAHGIPHLTDFGLAKSLDHETSLTETSEVLGTLGYMAPEQAAGQACTSEADIYSLGAILYELLTGRPPFEGSKVELLRKILEDEPVHPKLLNPLVDPELAIICLKCLDRDSSRRYLSALALAEDLERWQRYESISARRAGSLLRLRRWTRRNPAGAMLIACMTVAIFLSLGLLARTNVEKTRKSVALDILRTESARQLQEIWLSASTSIEIKSETLSAMAGMDVGELTEAEDRFSFGTSGEGNPLDKVLRAAHLFQQVQDHWADNASTPARFDLHLYKEHARIGDDIVKKKIDFAQINIREFLRLRDLDKNLLPVVAIVPASGVKDKAVLFTSKRTGIQYLAGLKGKSILFGLEGATTTFWAKVSLMDSGVRGRDLARYRYIDQTNEVTQTAFQPAPALGNPYSSMTAIEAVMSSVYDAALVSEKRFREVATDLDLVALDEFVDNGLLIVARGDIPLKAAEKFQRSLFGINSIASESGAVVNSYRFEPVSEQEFQPLRQKLDAEQKFHQ